MVSAIAMGWTEALQEGDEAIWKRWQTIRTLARKRHGHSEVSAPAMLAPLLDALRASTAWLRFAKTKGAVIAMKDRRVRKRRPR